MSAARSADRIDLVRARLFTTIAHVRDDLERRERHLGRNAARLYVSPETKFWHHDWHGVAFGALDDPKGPRGEAILVVPNWRDVLDAAEANPNIFGAHGLAAFVAAHGDNCLHPWQPRSWSAFTWASYHHALRRNPFFNLKLASGRAAS